MDVTITIKYYNTPYTYTYKNFPEDTEFYYRQSTATSGMYISSYNLSSFTKINFSNNKATIPNYNGGTYIAFKSDNFDENNLTITPSNNITAGTTKDGYTLYGLKVSTGRIAFIRSNVTFEYASSGYSLNLIPYYKGGTSYYSFDKTNWVEFSEDTAITTEETTIYFKYIAENGYYISAYYVPVANATTTTGATEKIEVSGIETTEIITDSYNISELYTTLNLGCLTGQSNVYPFTQTLENCTSNYSKTSISGSVNFVITANSGYTFKGFSESDIKYNGSSLSNYVNNEDNITFTLTAEGTTTLNISAIKTGDYTLTQNLTNCSSNIKATTISNETVHFIISANNSYDFTGYTINNITVTGATISNFVNYISKIEFDLLATADTTITINAKYIEYTAPYNYFLATGEQYYTLANAIITSLESDGTTEARFAIDSVQKIMQTKINIDLDSLENGTLYSKDVAVLAPKVSNKYIINFTSDKIKFSGMFNNFRDFSPNSEYKLSLPFAGIFDVDDKILNHEIYFEIYFDITSGNLYYIMYVDGISLYNFTGKGAQNFPYRYDSQPQIELNELIYPLYNIEITQIYHNTDSNLYSRNNTIYGDFPTENGYYEFENIFIDNFDITNDEIEEIKRVLRGGIVI